MVVVAPMVEDGESMFVARIVVMVDVCSESGAKVEHNFILIFLKITYKLNILNCLKKIRRTFFAFGFDFKQQF